MINPATHPALPAPTPAPITHDERVRLAVEHAYKRGLEHGYSEGYRDAVEINAPTDYATVSRGTA